MATGTIGAKIVLEGEAEYRKALRNIRTEQAELRSEMKLTQSQYAKAQNSLDALKKKHEVLSKQLEASVQKVKIYEKALEDSTEKESRSKKRIDELTKTLARLETEQAGMAESSTTTAEAMEEQKEAIEKTRRQLETANRDYESAAEKTRKYRTRLNDARTELNDLNADLKQNDRYLAEAVASTDGCAKSIDSLGKETRDTEDEIDTFGDILKANLTSEAIIAGLKTLVNGIKEITDACIGSGEAFEASMSNVEALSGATNEELERMTLKARELGASTIYSASEVADAMSYMALAGWNTEQTLSGIEPVLNLAAASAMDLATASDIVTDYLTAFGLSAEDAEKFTDELAYTMANSNTTVELLGESYKNCAATAASLGYSVEDVTAVLATMANAGVKGGEAGTALNTIMTRLATNTKGCADSLSEFGVSIYDSEGNMQSLSSILEGLGGVWEDLADQEQAALSKSIAGTNQYSSLQTIMNGLSEAAEESGMSFTDYAKALEDCNGSAEEMAATMQNNLKGKLTALDSAMEGLQIAAYDLFDESLKKGVDGATSAVQRLTRSVESGSLNTSLSKLSNLAEDLIDRVVSWSEKNLPKLIDGLGDLLSHSEEIGIALKTVVASLLAFKTANAVISIASTAMATYASITGTAAVAQEGLNAAVEVNPWAALATVLAGVTVATVEMTNANIDAMGKLTDEEEAMESLVRESADLVDSITSASDERAYNREELATESELTDGLVQRLSQLSREYGQGKDTMAGMQEVVAELNAAYPELNLQIDEQTGALNQSTDAIRENITEMQKKARLEAAQEDLTEIAREQYEAEKKLKDLEKQRAEAETVLATAQENLLAAQADSTQIFEDGGTTVNRYSNEVINARKVLNDLDSQILAISGEDGTLVQLGNEYQEVTDYIGENTPAVEESTETYGGLNDTLGSTVTLSEEASTAITDMYESVQSSIRSQIDLFSKYQEKDQVTTEELKKNLQDQTDALSTWADNMAELSERGIDENLYAKLAQLGPDGASYVQAFVDMTDEELKDYGQNFADALKLEDFVTEQITSDYAEVSGYILDGMALGLENDGTVTAAIDNVAADALEEWKKANGIESPSKEYRTISKNIPDGIKKGIEDNSRTITDAIEKMASTAKSEASMDMAASKFTEGGKELCTGIINGIDQKKGEVYEKIEDLAKEMLKHLKSGLQGDEEGGTESGNDSARGSGTSSAESVGTFARAMSPAGAMVDSVMAEAAYTAGLAGETSSPVRQMADLIAEYLPKLAENETNVNVTLKGDAKGLFTAVQSQNSIYKKTTGRSAFA